MDYLSMDTSESTSVQGCGEPTIKQFCKKLNWWTGRIFWKGYHYTLDEADIYDVLPQDSTVKLSNNLGREWEMEMYQWKTGGEPSLRKALWRCYRQQIFTFSLLILLEECLSVLQAIFMGLFLDAYESSAPGQNSLDVRIYAYGATLCLLYLISILLDHNYFHHGYKMRVATMSLIYRKVVRLPKNTLDTETAEDIMSLVTKGVDVFPMVVLPATYLVIGPFQTILVSYLLWDWLSFGPICMAGIFVLLLLIPLQILMGKVTRVLRKKTDLYTSMRLRKIQAIISAMQEVKMTCWEKICEKFILSAREEELVHVKKLSNMLWFNSALTLTAGKVVIFTTFILYIVAGNTLNATQIFTAVALLETLRVALSLLLPSGLLYLSEALETIKKIQRVLLLEEKGHILTGTISLPRSTDETAIKFTNYSASRDKALDAPWVLYDVSCKIEKKSLCAVVGHPQSGRTSLLLAVLGELVRHKGTVQHQGSLSYVSEQSWIYSGTIRENIVFGAEFIRSRYNQILDACSLYHVMSTFPLGDLTVIGDRGVSVDESLKARIALARAVYHNSDIILIDNIFQLMDSKMSTHIFKRCINGLLLKDKTKIFITDDIYQAKAADKIIYVSEGQVPSVGRYEDLQNTGVNLKNVLTSRTFKHSEVNKLLEISSLADSNSQSSFIDETRERTVTGTGVDFIQQDYKDIGEPLVLGSDTESTTGGSPTKEIYWQYFVLGGGLCCFSLFIIISSLGQSSFIMCEWWLAYWSESRRQYNQSVDIRPTLLGPSLWTFDIDIYIYIGLVIITVFLGFIQAIVFFRIANKVSLAIHSGVIKSLMCAPVSFFESNNIGNLFSRLSHDINTVDFMAAPYLDCIQSISLLVGTYLVVGVSNYWLLLLVVPAVVLFILARNYFLNTTLDVERIEIASRSDVSSHIASTMEGIQSLRAFGVEERFLHNFDVYQDRSTASCYLHLAANRWFGMRVDVLGLIMVIGLTFGCILVLQYQDMKILGSLVGLSLLYTSNLTNVQQPSIRKSASIHFKMASLDRLLQCHQIPSEPEVVADIPIMPPSTWPQYGIVTFEGVSVSHTPKGPNILKSIWCCVRAYEKVGILFKTAAEQKAFVSVLYRFMDFTGVVRIDGIDVLNLTSEQLRDKISIIPQNPTLFLGTVRQNLDPVSKYTDAQVWRVLEEVHLASFIERLPGKLYTDISLFADNLNVGYRQLLRLSRALLKQSKVIIYEEPNSSPDLRCNTLIQTILKSRCEKTTVIHIAHLPDTVVDADRVMIIADGRVAEVDSPYLLLQNKRSKLYKLLDEFGDRTMENLKRIAQDKYENKPYVPPAINAEDFENGIGMNSDNSRNPSNMNVLPSFHSSRLVGVLNQLPTNKFSTNRL